MEVQEYLKSRLETCCNYELTELDNKLISKEGVESFILKVITRSKYRKWSISDSVKANLLKAIKLNMEKNEPIKFTFPFGGYKLWSLKSAPEVDWAEFFTIAYYLEFLAPIAKAYEPGIILSFSSDDVIIERMDNIPKEDTDRYYNSFKKLLTYFNASFPYNFKVEIKRVADMYNPEEFEQELKVNYARVAEQIESWDMEKKEKYLESSKLNFCVNGVIDLTNDPKEVERRINEGSIYHDSYCSMTRRRGFVRGEDKIVLFCTPINNSIPLGTTKNSITKFWTGFGILETKRDSFRDRILSPKQIESFFSTNYKKEKVDLIDLTNFSEILIHEGELNFVNENQS